MSKTTWQKRLAVLRSRLYLYPAPDPLSRTPLFWIAMGLVSLMVLLFSGFFIAYAISRQDAFLTAATDATLSCLAAGCFFTVSAEAGAPKEKAATDNANAVLSVTRRITQPLLLYRTPHGCFWQQSAGPKVRASWTVY